MKKATHIPSILLTLALALALLVPVSAIPNPVPLPGYVQLPIYVAAGKEFTLEIGGDPFMAGVIARDYQWYRMSVPPLGDAEAIAGATDLRLTLTAQLPPKGSGGRSWAGNVLKSENYYCKVTTTFDDGTVTELYSTTTLVHTYYDLAGAKDYLAAQWDLGAFSFLRALGEFAFIPFVLAHEWLNTLLGLLRKPGADGAPG